MAARRVRISTWRERQNSVTRIDKHDLPKRRVAARLRRMGLSVRLVPGTLGHDLLVDGDRKVTLRVAFPSQRQHRVTVGDRKYTYRYKTWHFNFHHHGKFDTRYTDFFVCLAVSEDRGAVLDAFIIPWEHVTGKTFSLHGGRRGYEGRYAAYRGNWDAILTAGRQELISNKLVILPRRPTGWRWCGVP